MAKIVLVCYRDSATDFAFPTNAKVLSASLTPGNITETPPQVIVRDGIHVAIFNPSPAVQVRESSVCLGALFGPTPDWGRPGAEVPDGSYALFRADRAKVELVTDILASRTIWFAHTEDMFIASTSQRAIVFFLRDFQPNREAFAWMLAAGNLGPGNSWDRRIRPLPPDSRLSLDRRSWQATLRTEKMAFEPLSMPERAHRGRLEEAIQSTFAALDIDLSRWIIALSGGFDSRAILLFLSSLDGVTAVTWGTSSTSDDPKSDAAIAPQVARSLGINHLYFTVDPRPDAGEKTLDTFLLVGEGRVANISAYVDGFALWEHLQDAGWHGIVRGDEAFGYKKISSQKEVYSLCKMVTLNDLPELRAHAADLDVVDHSRPSNLEQRAGETLASWRDRLDHEFHMPTVVAALNDLKAPYLEVINPLLSRRIIQCVRSLPDTLRTDKALYKTIVRSRNRGTPFAKRSAILPLTHILTLPYFHDLIWNTIDSTSARSLLSDRLISFILDRYPPADNDSLAGNGGKPNDFSRALHSLSRRLTGRRNSSTVSADILALRAYIVCRMVELLALDARRITNNSFRTQSTAARGNSPVFVNEIAARI